MSYSIPRDLLLSYDGVMRQASNRFFSLGFPAFTEHLRQVLEPLSLQYCCFPSSLVKHLLSLVICMSDIKPLSRLEQATIPYPDFNLQGERTPIVLQWQMTEF